MGQRCADDEELARLGTYTSSIASAKNDSQHLWIGVSRGLLISLLVVGSVDEFAVLESGPGRGW